MSKEIKNSNMEYRTATMELAELRLDSNEEQGRPVITGYAAVFNELSQDLGGFREQIAPGAFKRALEMNQDVRALVDHDPSRIIGRSTSGTLEMIEDDHGLRVQIDPADTTAGRDIMESINRGDVSGMSFGFVVRDEDWDMRDGENIRTVRDMDLFDVSVVTFPAYTASSVEVALRSLDDHKMAMAEVDEDIRRADAMAHSRAKLRIAESE